MEHNQKSQVVTSTQSLVLENQCKQKQTSGTAQQDNRNYGKSQRKYLSQRRNQLLIDFPQTTQDDYQIIERDTEQSLKYKFTLMNKPIHILNSQYPINSLKNRPLVCSYADMQFKLSPVIHRQWLRLMSKPKLVLGYMFVQNKVNQLLLNRIKKNIFQNVQKQWLSSASSMLALYYSAVTQFTKQNDTVLIFTPTYYRFLFTLKDKNLNIIEYQLKTRQTQKGKQFFIDFEELQKLFKQNNIKFIVWANSHNPSGRVWLKDELQKLKNLVVQHKSIIFSDDIFCQCLIDPKKYTSLLNFEDIHPYLIWASSFGKAFNCSGNSYSYCVIPNSQNSKRIFHSFEHIPLFVDYSQFKLLESCYTVGQQWRVATLKYIEQNYKILKEQSKRRNLKLEYYTLDSSYLCVIDFTKYNWTNQEIKNRIQAQNIFPTYFDSCYLNKQINSIQIIRMNLAMNKQVLFQLIERLQKALK